MEPAFGNYFFQINPARPFFPDQLFTVPDPELVQVIGEMHAHLFVEKSRELVQRHFQVVRQVSYLIMLFQKRLLLQHIGIQPVPDKVNGGAVGLGLIGRRCFIKSQ